MKNVFFVYTQGPRGVYMIWGHYIIENGTSNLVPTSSNVLWPYDYIKTSHHENFEKYIFCVQKVAFFGHFWYAKK